MLAISNKYTIPTLFFSLLHFFPLLVFFSNSSDTFIGKMLHLQQYYDDTCYIVMVKQYILLLLCCSNVKPFLIIWKKISKSQSRGNNGNILYVVGVRGRNHEVMVGLDGSGLSNTGRVNVRVGPRFVRRHTRTSGSPPPHQIKTLICGPTMTTARRAQ